MTQETVQKGRYETPTFSPSGAFATTLRSAEMARLGRLGKQASTHRGTFARKLQLGRVRLSLVAVLAENEYADLRVVG